MSQFESLIIRIDHRHDIELSFGVIFLDSFIVVIVIWLWHSAEQIEVEQNCEVLMGSESEPIRTYAWLYKLGFTYGSPGWSLTMWILTYDSLSLSGALNRESCNKVAPRKYLSALIEKSSEWHALNTERFIGFLYRVKQFLFSYPAEGQKSTLKPSETLNPSISIKSTPIDLSRRGESNAMLLLSITQIFQRLVNIFPVPNVPRRESLGMGTSMPACPEP